MPVSCHEYDDFGEEAILVQHAKEGNDEAFDLLYQRHSRALCAYVYKMTGSYEEAPDLTQTAFLTAWRNLDKLQIDSAFKSWLYGIATHQTRAWLRRRRQFEWQSLEESLQKLELSNILENMCEAPPDERVVAQEIGRMALRQVTESYRACLLLQILGGFKQVEIAQLLQISPKSVSVYVKRALRQLQKAHEAIENDIKSDLEKRPR